MARILFVKTSSLGDVVHNCPAVSDVARALPGARIDWVVEEAFAGIPRLHRAVNEVIPVALRRWRRAPWRPAMWREVAAFDRTLRARRYDAVIDTQGLLKSALVTRRAQGPRHGMDSGSAREALAASFYDARHNVPRAQHAVDRNRSLAAQSLAFAVEGAADFGLRTPDASPSAPYAVLLTMTSRADKLWPEERWLALGRELAMPLVLPWGSEAERLRAQRIAAALPQAQVPERMALDALASLFAGARCVIGVDTGLTHLAAALGARTLGIYCGSDPALTGLYALPGARNVGALGHAPGVDEVLAAL
jgi:heptosyltransferase-1